MGVANRSRWTADQDDFAEDLNSWIKRGLLKAGRITGQNLFVVSCRDLRQFLLAYPSHWDHRLADRWFLLDILCGDEIVAASRNAAHTR